MITFIYHFLAIAFACFGGYIALILFGRLLMLPFRRAAKRPPDHSPAAPVAPVAPRMRKARAGRPVSKGHWA